VTLKLLSGLQAGADEEFTESKLQLKFSADSMNNALIEWEPLIEPCHMTVEAVVFTQTLRDEIKFTTLDAMNVNVTRKMLVSMQAAADNWKRHVIANGPQLPISNFQTAYELRNDTIDDIVPPRD
jgi:hypothetical protein